MVEVCITGTAAEGLSGVPIPTLEMPGMAAASGVISEPQSEQNRRVIGSPLPAFSYSAARARPATRSISACTAAADWPTKSS